MIHIVRIPQRFEHRVGETHRQNILNGFLAQVVVDTEHVLLIEDARDCVRQFAGRFEVVTEWLFDDHPAPLTILTLVQTSVR